MTSPNSIPADVLQGMRDTLNSGRTLTSGMEILYGNCLHRTDAVYDSFGWSVRLGNTYHSPHVVLLDLAETQVIRDCGLFHLTLLDFDHLQRHTVVDVHCKRLPSEVKWRR